LPSALADGLRAIASAFCLRLLRTQAAALVMNGIHPSRVQNPVRDENTQMPASIGPVKDFLVLLSFLTNE